MHDSTPLRLMACNESDLEVLSAACQDGLLKMTDLSYSPKERFFSLELNRFQWERNKKKRPYFRVRSLLRFDSVTRVRSRNMPDRNSDGVMSLLAVRLDQSIDAEDIKLSLVFADGGEVQLTAECIDVTLMDTDKFWPTARKPSHSRGIW